MGLAYDRGAGGCDRRPYSGGIIWPTTYEIAAHWLNRRQNYTVLRFCNVVTRECPVSIGRNTPTHLCLLINANVSTSKYTMPSSQNVLLIKPLNAEISDCQKVKLYRTSVSLKCLNTESSNYH